MPSLPFDPTLIAPTTYARFTNEGSLAVEMSVSDVDLRDQVRCHDGLERPFVRVPVGADGWEDFALKYNNSLPEDRPDGVRVIDSHQVTIIAGRFNAERARTEGIAYGVHTTDSLPGCAGATNEEVTIWLQAPGANEKPHEPR